MADQYTVRARICGSLNYFLYSINPFPGLINSLIPGLMDEDEEEQTRQDFIRASNERRQQNLQRRADGMARAASLLGTLMNDDDDQEYELPKTQLKGKLECERPYYNHSKF